MAPGTLGKGTLKSMDLESEGIQGSLSRRNWGNRFERGDGGKREEICRLGVDREGVGLLSRK